MPSGFALSALLINRWRTVINYALGHRKDMSNLLVYLEVWVPAFALVAFLSDWVLRRRDKRTNKVPAGA